MQLTLTQPVHCRGEAFGELADIVIDPITQRVTHLVVQPHGDNGSARLVPVALAVDTAGGDGISLTCTASEVLAFDTVRELTYLRMGTAAVDDPEWDVGVEDVLAMPYYESAAIDGYVPPYDATDTEVLYDRIPKGMVEIRRTSPVVTADEHFLGKVDGFIVDDEQHITHVVLEHGHLWGHREVTIPMSGVAKVETDQVTLSLSKDEVEALPSVRVHRRSH